MGPKGRKRVGDRLRQVLGQAGGLHGRTEREQGGDQHERAPLHGRVQAVVRQHAG